MPLAALALSLFFSSRIHFQLLLLHELVDVLESLSAFSQNILDLFAFFFFATVQLFELRVREGGVDVLEELLRVRESRGDPLVHLHDVAIRDNAFDVYRITQVIARILFGLKHSQNIDRWFVIHRGFAYNTYDCVILSSNLLVARHAGYYVLNVVFWIRCCVIEIFLQLLSLLPNLARLLDARLAEFRRGVLLHVLMLMRAREYVLFTFSTVLAWISAAFSEAQVTA